MTKQVMPNSLEHKIQYNTKFYNCFKCKFIWYLILFLDKISADKPVVIDVDEVKVKDEKEDNDKKVR